MKKQLLLIVIFSLSLALTACANNKAEHVTIKPVHLFSGEAKKFQPFLGNLFGAVHIKYTGDKNFLEATLALWENGEKTQSVGAIGTPLIEKNGQFIFDQEIIISIDNENDAEGAPFYIIKTAFVDKNGVSGYKFRYKPNKEYSSFGPLLTNDKPIYVSENEVAFAWGVQATSTNSISTLRLTEEDLTKTEWALVLKIELKDEPV